MKRALALLLLLAGMASAANITSAGSGDWATGATWDGETAPGDGDTATIATGHVVTVSSKVTIGSAGATGVAAVTVQGSGELHIDDTLVCKGDLIQQRGTTVEIGPGGVLQFNAGSGVRYEWGGSGTGTGNFYGRIAGSSESPGIVEKTGDGQANIDFSNGGSWLFGKISFNYAELRDLGTTGTAAASRAIDHWQFNSTCTDSVRNTLIEGCGPAYFTNTTNDGIICWENVDIRNSQHVPIVVSTANLVTTGTRAFRRLTVWPSTGMDTIRAYGQCSFDECLFYNLRIETSSNGRQVVIDSCFFVSDSIASGLGRLTLQSYSASSVSNSVFLGRGANQHYVSESDASVEDGCNEYTRNIFSGDGYYETDAGDCFVPRDTALVSRNIIIDSAGVLLSALVESCRAILERNTVVRAFGANIGESAGDSNQVVSATNNLFVSCPDGFGQEPFFVPQANFELDYNGSYDIGTAGNADYPVGHAFAGENSYLGAASVDDWWSDERVFGTGNATHDIVADPQFNEERRVRGYSSAASVRAMAGQFVTVNGRDSSGSATTPTEYTIGGLLAYIREGFAPGNAAYDGTGEGGVDIGAEDYNPTLPVITTDPASDSIEYPGTAIFFVECTNADSYQWQRRAADSSTWENEADETDDTLTFAVTQAMHGDSLRCIATNTFGADTSSGARLAVYVIPASITSDPDDSTVTAGDSVSFGVTADSADSYQWERYTTTTSWVSEAGATSDTVRFVATHTMDGDSLRCIATNEWGSDTSAGALLTVVPDTVAITAQPANDTVDDGGTASFSVTATGNPTPTYQWQDSADGGDWANVSGATLAAFSFAAALADSGTGYRCLATNAGGTDTSDVALLVVNGVAPVVSNPANQSARIGALVRWIVTTTGSGTVGRQWQDSEDGETWADMDGETTDTLLIDSATAAMDSTLYRIVASSDYGADTSTAALLRVSEAPSTNYRERRSLKWMGWPHWSRRRMRY